MLGPTVILISLLAVLTIIILLFIYLFCAAVTALRGAPYVASSDEKVEKAITLAGVAPGMKVVDLGSGDGRVVIELAKRGCVAYGYEINPFLVLRSRYRIKKAGLQGKAFVCWKNFWKKDLSSFDLIFVYGISPIMKGLDKKLRRELKPGTKIISVTYPLPNWEHRESAVSSAYSPPSWKNKSKHDTIYLYVK